MALEGSFRDLSAHLQEVHEALIALRTTTREDKPLEDDAVLVDFFGDAADDLLGWVEGALRAAGEAHQATQHPADLQRMWRALSTCQERFNHVQQQYADDLVVYERIAELSDLAQRRGGEWHPWATGVKAALDDCRPLLYAVNTALFVCWQEVGERIGMGSANVHMTNFGQYLALAGAKEF